ncbi:hypothetical protein TRIP_C80001 [Candidatus Zixiibacteriota bacterium]|nr:hypothetical protein TRIP_C80001 [candidate division Zixibacteria bacterium]
MIIQATDACGQLAADTVCVDIHLDECIHVQIEKVHNAYQGHHQLVDIRLNGSGKQLGGFDFLVAYDNSALSPGSVLGGDLLSDCGWEYFTYRFGYDGNCTSCPSGLIRIVGMAETNNGAYHPSCYLNGRVGVLASIDFLVTNNRTFECQYVPVRFFWVDCGDNSISSKGGDTLWVSRDVYDFQKNLITDYNSPFPTYLGAQDSCLVGGGSGKPAPIRCIDFIDGGVDIVCADSIDLRGDINLNGVANEIGDAVVFTNYFIYGLSAFVVNIEGQIAATDVNADGMSLSVADLVYLIRVIIGDAQPAAKPNPGAYARIYTDDDLVKVETNSPLGAVLLIFDGDACPVLTEAAQGMEIKSNYENGITRVLLYSMTKGLAINSGDILKISRSAKLVSADAADYLGAAIRVNSDRLVPVDFSLGQNYPNPFNPITTIEFALPVAGEYELAVFNILGQKVESWRKYADAGYHRIEWDASRCASGVYFYRLTAGKFQATKKMIILK